MSHKGSCLNTQSQDDVPILGGQGNFRRWGPRSEVEGHLGHVVAAVVYPQPFLFLAQLPVRNEVKKLLDPMFP